MSWEQLQAIVGQNKEGRLQTADERPVACPLDGTPLDDNGKGVLNCPMGNYTWSGYTAG